MGSKIEAKRLMAEAGVPVLPELDPAQVNEDALPVLVKASAGGGRRGMRVVRQLAELPATMWLRSPSIVRFGDGTVFCEPYLETGRHIEVQVMAGTHGPSGPSANASARSSAGTRRWSRSPAQLVERLPGCATNSSTPPQGRRRDRLRRRRHRRVPGPGGRPLLLPGDEHPPPGRAPGHQLTTGLDLVALQLTIADGATSPDPPSAHGHAIEVRLYDEDPSDNWRPKPELMRTFHWSQVTRQVRGRDRLHQAASL